MSSKVILAVSDVHLSRERSNKLLFLKFLDHLIQERDDVTDLVLCGDILDMWYKGLDDVITENTDVLTKLKTFKEKKANRNVYYLVGNHDYFYIKYENKPLPQYDLSVERDKVLEDNGKKYRFTHGDQYDSLQHKEISEALCHTDEITGLTLNKIWDALEDVSNWAKEKTWFTRWWWRNQVKKVLKDIEERPKDAHNAAKKACKKANPDETLIFGHTHQPGWNSDENIVNCGSWIIPKVTTPDRNKPSNTYVEIKNGTV